MTRRCFQPVHFRHLDIHEHQVIAALFQGLHGQPAVDRRIGAETELGEQAHGQLSIRLSSTSSMRAVRGLFSTGILDWRQRRGLLRRRYRGLG